METTQLACPHCGATLNFGVKIAAGTPVECMNCMRIFEAVNPVAVPVIAQDFPGTLNVVEPMAELCDEIAITIPEMTATESTCEIPSSQLPEAVVLEEIEEAEIIPQAIEIETKPVAKVKPTTDRVKKAPRPGILISKPYSPPLASAIAQKTAPILSPVIAKRDKANPRSTESITPPVGKTEESGTRGKVALLAVTFGFLFLLTGGIAFAAWKVTTAARFGPAGSNEAQAAAKWSTDSNSKNDKSPGKLDTPPGDDDDERALNSKIQDEVKQSLKRKVVTKVGSDDNDLGGDLLTTVNMARRSAPGIDQRKINMAIDKGVAYLKKNQNQNGTWHHGHGVGYASIGGLTLLECDIPGKDMNVQRAAAYVRSNVTSLTSTYELSLAILFLDRLKEARDKSLIQGMALRLLAGQLEGGGWTYSCPTLTPQEMFQLYGFLNSNKQPKIYTGLTGDPLMQTGIALNPGRDPISGIRNLNTIQPINAFQQLNELILTQGIADTPSSKKPDPKSGNIGLPVEIDPKAPKDGKDAKMAKDAKEPPEAKKKPTIRPEMLVPSLRQLPIVQNQGVKKSQSKKFKHGREDNSNTQFALLALWAARRHGVPTDQGLLLAYQRFAGSQNREGGWGYQVGSGSTNTMTNVGLLGLAMGHGAAPEIVQFNPNNPKDVMVKPALQDPQIQKGLQALSHYIGQPSLDEKKTSFPMENLYLLWSIERVAMLYDLKTIGGKDWYGWGAQILIHNQQAGGDWPGGHYHGSSPPLNTCFALLFLRRSNLVQDLTNNLRLHTGIRDVE